MAFEYEATDPRDGTVYPAAYAKLAFLKIDRRNRTVEAWFNNYPDAAARYNNTVAGKPGVLYGKFGQTKYTITAQAQGAELQYTGPELSTTDAADAAKLATLKANGVTLSGTAATHDGVTPYDKVALATLGITVLDPSVPSYADYFAAIASTVAVVDALVANHIAAHPQAVIDALTGAACPDGVHTWKVLYIDPVTKRIGLDTDTYRDATTQVADKPIGRGRFDIGPDDYDAFLASTAANATAAIDALAFDFARPRRPYRTGHCKDVLDLNSQSSSL